jgi:prepilin-type processing-associated H-X9-DG protein
LEYDQLVQSVVGCCFHRRSSGLTSGAAKITVLLDIWLKANESTLTLIEGDLEIMAWSKTKTAVVAGLVLILAAGTTKLIDRNAPNVPFRQESIGRMNQAKQWALALILYAEAHRNQLPNNYATGLSESNWEIVSSGDEKSIVNPSQTILLREKEPRQSPNGKFLRTYAFADGHAELISSPDRDFTALEERRGFLIRPAKN